MKSCDLLVREIKSLKIIDPTFVAGSKKLQKLTERIADRFDANYAFILEETGYFDQDISLVLCGHINKNAVLLIDENKTSYWRRIDLYDLVKCAGARNVYIKRVNDSKVVKSKITYTESSFSNRMMS